jgi:hypothetical protein
MTMQEFMDAEGDFANVNATYEIYDLFGEMRDECTDFDPSVARRLVEDAAQAWRVANPNIAH